MDRRYLLFFICTFLVIQAWFWWMSANAPEPPPETAEDRGGVETEVTTGTLTTSGPEPIAADGTDAGPVPLRTARRSDPAPTVEIQTETYHVVFTARGGVPVRWDIIDPRFTPPPENGESTREVLIDSRLKNVDDLARPFEVILRELNGPFYKGFNLRVHEYETIEREIEGVTWTGVHFISERTAGGLELRKTFLFPPEGFVSRVELELRNLGDQNLAFDAGGAGLGLTLGPGLGEYRSDDEKAGFADRFQRVVGVFKTGEELEYERLSKTGQAEEFASPGFDWAGLHNMYFMMTLLPEGDQPLTLARMELPGEVQQSRLASSKTVDKYPLLELYGDPFRLAPRYQVRYAFEVFAGPKQRDILKAAGHDLSRMLFYDSWPFMRWLCLGLMALLGWLYDGLNNWGLSIMLLTVIVRLASFPLVHKGMKSQAKFQQETQRLKPLMDKINKKYENDPQRKQQEIMKLYREHGVNPLGMLKGCGWMIIQMPIFFALYKLLYQTVDLRGAEFLWVSDLSQPDRLFGWGVQLPLLGEYFNALPLITAATQMLASKLSTSTQVVTDPQQAQMQKMMLYVMPLVILAFTYQFPAGLMLYWFVSNFWQILQQYWVNKHIRQPAAAAQAAAEAKAEG